VLSSFESALAETAVGEYERYHFFSEDDQALAGQIRKYWTDLQLSFPGVRTAWSAIFVCWCLKRAGATKKEFLFSPRHATFVRWAITNAEARAGAFQALPINECTPSIGDIIHNNRDGNKFDYAYAATHSKYDSHSAIVVDTGRDGLGRFATTIGGNESDSIRRKRVALNEDGYIVQRDNSPYICVLQTLK
jgi:hypothetical protein